MMPKSMPSSRTKRRVSHIIPRDTLNLIPVSSPVVQTEKRKREREWERNFKPVSFYIPVHSQERVTKAGGVRDTLRAIANRELVKVDDVAREFIDYGLHSYETGKLKIDATPKAQSQKLHVNMDAVKWEPVSAPNPAAVTLGTTIVQPQQTNQDNPKRKLVVLSYRWGENKIREQVRDVAAKHGAYPGDVAVLFLEYSIQHYLENRMQLTIRPTMEKTVVGWSKRGK